MKEVLLQKPYCKFHEEAGRVVDGAERSKSAQQSCIMDLHCSRLEQHHIDVENALRAGIERIENR
jgi:hypothetical protein